MSGCDHHAGMADPMAQRLAAEAAAGCPEAQLLMSRRQMMGLSAGLFSAAMLPSSVLAAGSADPRLLVVVLRGGMDGLSTVVPHGDGHYAGLRGDLALPRSATIPLNSDFGLHPALAKFAKLYKAGQGAVVHATAPPLRNRSHFDAQDNLENGLPGRASNPTGWLNRLLTALPAGEKIKALGGIEIGEAPLILRGPAPVLGWSPTWFQHVEPALRENVRSLYRKLDRPMLSALDRGIRADRLAEKVGGGSDDLDPLRKGFVGAGRLLGASNGPRVAALSVGGWDTHADQGVLEGPLATLLGVLDTGLDDFRLAIGNAWKDTIVVCVTEFGRTARINGDEGTDHGVGTVALLAGGALNGGRIFGDWPGLAPGKLYEGSDLKPTTDLRSVFKGLLVEHLDVPRSIVERTIFPESAAAPPLKGLARATRSAADPGLSAGFDAPRRAASALADYRRAHGSA